MFRTLPCSSSGGLIVSMQHLVSSLSVGDCPVQRLAPVHRTGWYHPKHVEQFPGKINCVMLHLVGYILEYY